MNTAMIADAASLPADLIVSAAALPARTATSNSSIEATEYCGSSVPAADSSTAALSSVLEMARGLCRAGTAGLSLFSSNRADEMIVRWEAVRGALTSYEGIETPRQFSPCGLCLDAGQSILVSRPSRAFAWLENTRPSIVEELIVPLRDSAGNVLGTLWIAHHDQTSRFWSDDVHIAERLAHQLVLALRLDEQARDRRHAMTLLQSHQRALRNVLARDLHRERRLRERAETAEREARRALLFKDAMILEVNHRTKNTFQVAATLLSLEARAAHNAQARRALLDSQGRLQLLAEAHALLYREPGREPGSTTQTVHMAPLLQTTCDALRLSFGSSCPGVTMRVACDPISLPAEDAISIALLVNEAVMNAYKHAFPDGSAGEIEVQLRQTFERGIVLRITDSGVGADLTDTEGSMGMKLIRMLAVQLHGALEVGEQTHAAGTQITLTIDHVANRDGSGKH